MSRKSIKSWDFGISIGDSSRGSHISQNHSTISLRKGSNGPGEKPNKKRSTS